MNDYVNIYPGSDCNLYIGIIPCDWKNVEIKEYQDMDEDAYYATTGTVDVSKSGVLFIEMSYQ